MKLSFSTLGCPDWKWSEILSTAKDLGYDGIEIRGIGADIYAPDIKIFKDENIENTKNELKELGLEIPLFASSCYFNLTDKDYLKEAKEYVILASKLGAKGVRVLGETSQEPTNLANDALFIERLKELCDFAKGYKVDILVETNGVYSYSTKLRDIIQAVNKENLFVLWDIQHPIRNYNERLDYTFSILKPYIKHIHIKDSVVENGRTVYKMLGKGNLPIEELLTLLKENNFEGYVSLEWLKRWNGDLEDAGIVFSHFITMIKQLIK